MTMEEIKGAVDALVAAGGGEAKLNMADASTALLCSEIRKSKVRSCLGMEGIVVHMEVASGIIRITRVDGGLAAAAPSARQPSAPPVELPQLDRSRHTYVVPALAADVIDALNDSASLVLWFKGPTGCGKTVLAHYLAERLGYQLVQVNCRPAMGPESFFGEKTLVVDEATGVNKVVWQDGPVVQAMQAGLDEAGNEVGKPGLLFIDEAAAMSTGVAIALNRLMESDDPRRTFVVDQDGGRVVRSHSKFRIILSANTNGRGATSMADALYTAQGEALDISLLNRVALTFRFGYSRKVEEHIVKEKVSEDRVLANLMKFRDAIRDHLRGGRLSTPFGTRQVVQICDAYRLYVDLAKAVYLAVFGKLLPEERGVYNETLVTVLGPQGDMMARFENEADVDYL